MNLSKEKFDLVRQQVIAKIHWGTGDPEVIEWLAEKWGIASPMSDNLIAEAHRAKRKAMRSKALRNLTISGVCLAGVFSYFGVKQGTLELSTTVVVVAIVGAVSLIFFLSSLVHVMRGEEAGPAD